MFCPQCGKDIPDNSAFCLKCGNALAGGVATTRKTAKKGLGVGVAIVIGALIIVFVILLSSSKHTPIFTPQPPAPVMVYMSNKLFSGQNTVKSLGYLQNGFTVEPGMENFHVVGHFSASGGFTNDIQAVLADDEEFQNWINGHQANVLYSTPRVTTGRLDVGPLVPGKYVIAFSNKTGLVERQVSAEILTTWAIQR
jgi:hypothetical protein